MTTASCVLGLIDCSAYSQELSPRKNVKELDIPLFASLSGSTVPATMLEASMLVDVNCVQLAMLLPDVLITLVRSIIRFLETLPVVLVDVAEVTVNSLALTRVIA